MKEEYIDYLLRLAGIGLVVVGTEATLGHFTSISFLTELPGLLETFTYLGAAVGLIDNTYWALTKKGLAELNL